MSTLIDKALVLHDALDAAGLPHALGGALALAWCTRMPRGTADIDLNIFAPTSAVRRVLDALPEEVVVTRENASELRRDGQSRLWWDGTPVDLFLTTHAFHEQAMGRVVYEPVGGALVPFLACRDLAVFKAFFDRLRDWADIEEMLMAQTIDADQLAETLGGLLGSDDARIERLRDVQRGTTM